MTKQKENARPFKASSGYRSQRSRDFRNFKYFHQDGLTPSDESDDILFTLTTADEDPLDVTFIEDIDDLTFPRCYSRFFYS